MKTMKGVGVHSLARSTWGQERCVGAPGCGLR
jgi:hypothetical protein